MPQSLVKILVHIVFSTKNRHSMIGSEFERGLYGYITGIIKNQGCKLIARNGTEDHIHLLVSLGRTTDIASLIGAIKRDSTKWMKGECGLKRFAWQKGYGAFSVSQSQVDAVIKYIANQKEHHKKQSFQDEFRTLLNRHGVEFDERYVWD